MSLVAILDADKEGFLRSSGSLIQTMGRAARNVNGKAVLYADVMTDSMRRPSRKPTAAGASKPNTTRGMESRRRSIVKPIDMTLVAIAEADYVDVPIEAEGPARSFPLKQRTQLIAELEQQMREAAKNFEFEKAAQFRDRLKSLKTLELP